MRKYGKDFQAMSEVLGNKNSGQCRNFFLNYRRRFNLLDVLSEYEKENNIPRSESCVNDAWDEVAGGEPDNNIYPPSSVDLTSTLQGIFLISHVQYLHMLFRYFWFIRDHGDELIKTICYCL